LNGWSGWHFVRAICALGASGFAHATPNLITNGGFETISPTTFLPTGWIVSDPQSGTVIVTQPGSSNTSICWVDVCPPVFAGNFSMAFGTVGELGSISQAVKTKVGTNYTLTFRLISDGGPDNRFVVKENSTVLFDESNIPASNPATTFDPNSFVTSPWSSADYQLITLTFTAAFRQTLLTFSGEDGCAAAGPPCFSNEWGNLGLDAVSLVDPPSAPEPSELGPLAIGLTVIGLALARRSRRITTA